MGGNLLSSPCHVPKILPPLRIQDMTGSTHSVVTALTTHTSSSSWLLFREDCWIMPLNATCSCLADDSFNIHNRTVYRVLQLQNLEPEDTTTTSCFVMHGGHWFKVVVLMWSSQCWWFMKIEVCDRGPCLLCKVDKGEQEVPGRSRDHDNFSTSWSAALWMPLAQDLANDALNIYNRTHFVSQLRT